MDNLLQLRFLGEVRRREPQVVLDLMVIAGDLYIPFAEQYLQKLAASGHLEGESILSRAPDWHVTTGPKYSSISESVVSVSSTVS